MFDKLALILVVLVTDSLGSLSFLAKESLNELTIVHWARDGPNLEAGDSRWSRIPPLAEAKGVAGLGKAGGDGTAGTDKAGQQVPPEVYNALTLAGTVFLLTLSVPFLLYGLNKLLNKVEDCFGCGPSSKGAAVAASGGRSQSRQRPGARESSGLLGQNFQNQHYHLQPHEPKLHRQPLLVGAPASDADPLASQLNFTADSGGRKHSGQLPGATIRMPFCRPEEPPSYRTSAGMSTGDHI